jgi:very-short-patch-repair endonuclease
MKQIPKAWRRHNRKRKKSSYEVIVECWLKELGAHYKREAAIGHCHADFLIYPRTLVEVNGCYWHKCLKCFPKPTKKQEAQRIRDFYRYQFFQKKGYRVVVIRGHEIDEDPLGVKEHIKKLCSSLDE